MVRGLIRIVLVLLVVVGAIAFFVGYRWGDGGPAVERPVATSGGREPLDTSRAREVGAEVGEKIVVGAQRAGDVLAEAGITAKIKSKMTLDDTLEASHVTVDTDGTVVTLGGRVSTPQQKARALQLARETAEVTSVVDHIQVE